MPLYDYDCSACGLRFEVMHGVHVDGPRACPACGSDRVRKAVAAPAVHFKGSGWAKKERRATTSAGAAKAASGEGDSAADGGASAEAVAADRDTSSSGGDASDTPGDTKREPRDTGRDGGRDSFDRAAKPTRESKPAPAASTAAD